MLIKSKLTNSVTMLVQLINESHWSLREKKKKMKSFTLRYWFNKMKKNLRCQSTEVLWQNPSLPRE